MSKYDKMVRIQHVILCYEKRLDFARKCLQKNQLSAKRKFWLGEINFLRAEKKQQKQRLEKLKNA